MQYHRSLLRTMLLLCGMIVLLASALRPPLPAPTASAAPLAQAVSANFASAVPCYNGNQSYMTACYAETVVDPTVDTQPAVAMFNKGGVQASISSLAQIGSVYGLAYDDGNVTSRRRVFMGAYARRFTKFGPGGPGAIYTYNLNTGAVSQFATVPGAVTNGHTAVYPGWSATPSNFDNLMPPWVGRSSLGDLEMGPSGRYLYVVNLENRTIYRVDTMSATPNATWVPIWSTTAANQVPFAIRFAPSIAPNDGPWLAIGIVDAVALHAYVMFLNTTSGQQLLMIDQDLRAPEIADRLAFYKNTEAPWVSWIDDSHRVNYRGDYQYDEQPILSGIEFSRDRSAIMLGFRDRLGDEYRHYHSGNNVNDVLGVFAMGDLLTYSWSGSAYTLLTTSTYPGGNSGACAGYTSWPAASDYFRDSSYLGSGAECVEPHPESLMGALAANRYGTSWPPSEEFVSTALDPLRGSSSGANWFSLSPYVRDRQAAIEVVYGGFLWKSALVGDVTALCDYAFLGDRVWNDTNANGVQDSGELGIANVEVDLIRSSNSSVVASAKTDANGWVYFAVQPNLAYSLKARLANWNTGEPLFGKLIAPSDQGNNDAKDSDISPLSGQVDLPGQIRDMNNLTIGMGFISQAQALGVIGDRVWNDANGNGVQNAGESGIDGTQLPVSVDLYCESAYPSCPPGYPKTTSINGSGTYRFLAVPTGRYHVVFRPPAGVQTSPARRGGNDATDSDGLTTRQICIASPPDGCPIQFLNLDQGLIAGVDVSITKSGPAQAITGNTIQYTLTWRNKSQVSIPAGSVVRDTLPTGITYVSASPAPSSRSGQTLTWTLGALSAAQSGTITINGTVDATAPASVTNTGTISTPPNTTDTTPGDNTSMVTTQIVRPDVGITKTGPATALVNDTLTFTLAWQNYGTAPAQGVRVTDTLPAGLTYVSASPAPSSQSGQTLTWNIPGTVNAGQSGTITVQAQVQVTAPVSLVNVSRITTTSVGDNNPSNDTSSTTTTVLRPNVRITKTAPANTAELSQLQYQLAWTNNGNVPAASVVVQDTLPSGLSFVSASPAPSSQSGQTLTWNLGTVAPNQSGTIVVNTLVATGTGNSTLINTGRISTTTPGDDPTDNTSTTSTFVIPPPPPPPPSTNWQISLRSTLDPLSSDANPANAVYRSTGTDVHWPAGEVLDWTPRVRISLPGAPPVYPYAYRARIVAWSFVSANVEGATRSATGADDMPSHGTGCRAGDRSGVDGSGMSGCVYRYIGGSSLSDPAEPTETEMNGQAHSYWSVGLPKAMRGDVYTYGLSRLGLVRLNVQIKVVVETYNVLDPTSSTLLTRTDTPTGTYNLTLVVPRDLK